MRCLLNFRAIQIFWAPILHLNKCQIWQQDFEYIQYKQTFDTATKQSVKRGQNSTQQNAVKLQISDKKAAWVPNNIIFKRKCHTVNLNVYLHQRFYMFADHKHTGTAKHTDTTKCTLQFGRASTQYFRKWVEMSLMNFHCSNLKFYKNFIKMNGGLLGAKWNFAF